MSQGYPIEFREMCVRHLKAGASMRKLSLETGVSVTSLRSWYKEERERARYEALAGFMDNKEMQEKIEQLTKENAKLRREIEQTKLKLEFEKKRDDYENDILRYVPPKS